MEKEAINSAISTATGLPTRNFYGDLSAMHEAEKTLPETKRGYYNAELFRLATKRNLSSAIKEPGFIFLALHATAAQRALAFLRTIGKWEDDE